MEIQQNDFWQTQARGTNENEYQLYLDFHIDENGLDPEGKPAKTFEEWLES